MESETTHVHRLVYAGVCEIWVETDGRTITKVLAAQPSAALVGCALDDLPDPAYVEAKLLA